MAKILPVILLIVLLAGTGGAQTLAFTGPERDTLLEGDECSIEWMSWGLKSLSIVAYGERTRLGESSRGEFVIVVGSALPAEDGARMWTIPWIDAVRFGIKLKGYDHFGRLVKVAIREFDFRPKVMADRTADGIYVDLHRRVNQRLYVQRNGRVTRCCLTSSSVRYDWRPMNVHPGKIHDHAGVFSVISKELNHWSTLANVNMAYAMRYHAGHYVHATSRNLYRDLGRPASHGCNRLTLHDARELYKMTPIGFRVEIIGPEG